MSQRICLITGATDGIGSVTASELAKKGFAVVVAARSAPKAETLIEDIKRSTPAASIEYIEADLASLWQVRRLAETFRRRHAVLDVLINNAGVFLPARVETEDGLETMFQVNYLSPFLLTNLLLDELRRSEQGRIVNLSSSVYSAGKFDGANLQSEKHFSAIGAYAATKLSVLMFTEELAARLRNTAITVNAVHPGIVRTKMMLKAAGTLRIMSYLSLPFSISPEVGARTSVYLASSPDVTSVSGRYFVRLKSKAVSNKFDTHENRALLWELSMKAAEEALRRVG